MTERALAFDTVVVGGGPAGIAAACTAAESGRKVALVDETPCLGGQIWRGQSTRQSAPAARKWLDRFRTSGATLIPGACIIASPEPGLLLGETADSVCQIQWQKLILAPGARELFLPFPGWTLPGVVGPGGLQSLIKGGWPVAGKRVVIAGSGPLLLAVADALTKARAKVPVIAEQASSTRVCRFGLGLWRHPSKFWEAVQLKFLLRSIPYRFGVWPLRAEGRTELLAVRLTDGHNTWSEDCDLLACGFGLVPNVELALAIGCELEAGFVKVDEWQATTMRNVYCVGECVGIGGADSALIEGQVAGYAASDRPELARRLFGPRSAAHHFRNALAAAFTLRPEIRNLVEKDTVVCRCEDVTFGQLQSFTNWREAKLHSRCGMGSCQGRVCGAAAKVLLGWGMESVRPPILPARVASLITSATPSPVTSNSLPDNLTERGEVFSSCNSSQHGKQRP